MTPEAAVTRWLADAVGLRVHARGHVPEGSTYPYATLYLPGCCGGSTSAAAIDLWYRGAGEAEPNAAARRLSAAISRGGAMVPFDGGAAWVRRGEPWCQPVEDQDDAVERRTINIEVEWLTATD